jgi:predicted ATPase/DNA-binding CsgD family transcriptional regulator
MSDLQAHTWMEPLAAREIQILGLISDGLSNREIAQELYLTLETIKWYNKQIYRKLGVNSRMQAAKLTAEQGLLEQESSAQHEEESRSGNLPAQLTSFVGREKEIAEIKELLKANRLVVLTGTGGSGKTRLALQVAADLSDYYRDGAWLVELAPLSDPNLVPGAIAQALKLQSGGDTALTESLKHFFGRKHLLLLLDNFEHLLEASFLVGELLSAAPQLSVLATSRERLHVYGEQEYPVHPLQLPDHQHPEAPEKLLSYEAINLFVQRAQSVQPDLEANENTLPAIKRICTQLDGLPLALELAASQVKIYPPPILAQQLGNRLGALPQGPRDLPFRQRTLHATIEWSENLLKPQERTLFARLAVFSAGATLEAIERICTPGLSEKIIELLSALVEKNLVLTRESPGGELRFSMLETIHDYARQRLAASDDAQEIHKLHAAYYTDLAAIAYREFRTSRHVYWFAKLRAEQENLRAALAWSLGEGDIHFALSLTGSLRDHWLYNGNAAEGYRWCELILEKKVHESPNLLAGVLCTAGTLAYNKGDIQQGEQLLRRSLELYQQSGDESGTAWALILLAISGVGDPEQIDRYLAMAQESLEAFRRLEDRPGMAQAYNILGELARSVGDYDAAQHYYEECLQLVKITGERMREAMQYDNLSLLAYHRGQYQRSLELILRGLLMFRELGANYGLAMALATMAGPISRLGDHEKAARLLGASDAWMLSSGINQQPADQIEVEKFQSAVRQALGEEAFQQAWQAGHEMSIEEALDYALNTR